LSKSPHTAFEQESAHRSHTLPRSYFSGHDGAEQRFSWDMQALCL